MVWAVRVGGPSSPQKPFPGWNFGGLSRSGGSHRAKRGPPERLGEVRQVVQSVTDVANASGAVADAVGIDLVPLVAVIHGDGESRALHEREELVDVVGHADNQAKRTMIEANLQKAK